MAPPREFEAAAAFIGQLVSHLGKLSPIQLHHYERALVHVMQQHYMKGWCADQPLRGSGNRCIRVHTNKIDPILIQAARLCNLETVIRTLFPPELVLWVDPHSVGYKISEFSPIVIVFDGEMKTNTLKLVASVHAANSQLRNDENFLVSATA